jgi:NADH-quinone oxidoreductase subunit I
MTNNFELANYSRDELFKNLNWLNDNNQHIRQENNSAMPKGGAKKDAE